MRLHLTQGEQVLLQERPSARSLIWPLIRLYALVIVMVPVIRALAVMELPFASSSPGLASGVSAGLAIAAAVVMLLLAHALGGRRIGRWLTTTYILTNERIIVRSGAGGRQEESIPLTQVRQVDLRRRWYQLPGSAGSLALNLGTAEPYLLTAVPAAERFRGLVVEALAAHQQRYWQGMPRWS